MRIFHVILSLSKTLKNKKLSSLTNTKLGGLFLRNNKEKQLIIK